MRQSESCDHGLRPWHGVVGAVAGMAAAQVAGAVTAVAYLVGRAVAAGDVTSDAITRGATSPGFLLAAGLPTEAVLLGAAVVTVWLRRAPLCRTLGWVGAPWPAYAAAICATLGVGQYAGLLAWAMRRWAPHLTFGTLDFMEQQIRSTPWVVLVLGLAVVPGFCEELLFRGLLQRALGSRWWAIVVASVAFGAYHLDPHHVLPTVLLGLTFGWLAARTGATDVAIVAHVVNNLAAVTLPRLIPSSMDEPPSGIALAAGAALFGVALIIVRRWVPHRPRDERVAPSNESSSSVDDSARRQQ